MTQSPRYLLLQIRDADDPMKAHELECFERALQTGLQGIRVFDLLSGSPTKEDFAESDIILVGGSGKYSVTDDGEWLEKALDVLREIHTRKIPTFASCWGHQAFARALGGSVETNLDSAEIGSKELWLTSEGKADPLFAPLRDIFFAQLGHQDLVTKLPRNATLLASSKKTKIQAYRFDDAPVYCTQFHPELDRKGLLLRLRTYPEYVENVLGITPDEFGDAVEETPETEALLLRFVEHVLRS